MLNPDCPLDHKPLPAAPWLSVDGLLAQFGQRRSLAQQRYAQFVAEGLQAASPWLNLKSQVFLGDEQFVQRMQDHRQSGKDDVQIPLAQRRPPLPPLAEIERHAQDRNASIVAAYATVGILTSKLPITSSCISRRLGKLSGVLADAHLF